MRKIIGVTGNTAMTTPHPPKPALDPDQDIQALELYVRDDGIVIAIQPTEDPTQYNQ